MTKKDLIRVVASRATYLTVRDVEVVINTVFRAMTQALVANKRIEVRGFGSLTARHRRKRDGRDPKTGAPIDVAAKRVPFFIASEALRRHINGADDLSSPAS